MKGWFLSSSASLLHYSKGAESGAEHLHAAVQGPPGPMGARSSICILPAIISFCHGKAQVKSCSTQLQPNMISSVTIRKDGLQMRVWDCSCRNHAAVGISCTIRNVFHVWFGIQGASVRCPFFLPWCKLSQRSLDAQNCLALFQRGYKSNIALVRCSFKNKTPFSYVSSYFFCLSNLFPPLTRAGWTTLTHF